MFIKILQYCLLCFLTWLIPLLLFNFGLFCLALMPSQEVLQIVAFLWAVLICFGWFVATMEFISKGVK